MVRSAGGRGASQGRGWVGSGVDEVGCQECGSWSALLCALWKMNRSIAGWVQAGYISPLTCMLEKTEGLGLVCSNKTFK